MNKTQSCLSREVLDQIGRDEILPNELQCIEDHVSKCEHCRDLFSAATAEPDWTVGILPILRERRDAMPGIVEADQSGGHDSVLSLLGPTDDPRMLGRIGSYEVTGVIGRGGMGIVFKAFDAPLNRFVAIKMLLPHLATSAAARKRFSREGQAAAAVIDDHVLPIYGVNEWQGMPYLVTQYSSGMSLQKRIQDQAPLALKEILRIALQTARGLAAAHAQGLVHRDVKPSNILLDGTVERALLTDFGLARAVDDASLTRSGTITGTPQFMAPEQARGESVNQRSDLFSLGAVIYAMCTGHPPFRAETSYGVLRRLTDEEPRPIREINSDIPEWMCGIVARLMAKQPDDRFASASEVAELLEKCLAHLQQPATVPLPPSVIAATPAAIRNRRPPMVKFIAAAAFAFALLFAGVLIVLELSKGQLRIQCDTDEVPIRIMQDDKVVKKLTVTKSGKTVRIAAGQYVVEVDGEIDGIAVEGGTVSLKRRGEETVKIVRTIAAEHTGEDSHLAGDQIGTVLGTHVFERDLNKNVELREDLVRLFVRPIEIHYLKQQGIDPEDELKRRIANEGNRVAALMIVRQRVLHDHLYKQRGGRVLLTAFGPIAYDAYRKWLEECEKAGLFELLRAEHRNLLFEPLNDGLRARLTDDPDVIRQACDPASINEFIQNVAAGRIELPASDVPTIASANAINEELAELTANVHHDFATDGVPRDRFAVRGQDEGERIAAKPDGLLVTHPGRSGFSISSVQVQLRAHGNFEITATFQNLSVDPGDDGSAGLSLTAILESTDYTHCTVHRGAVIESGNPVRNIIQSEFLRNPQSERIVTWRGTTLEEATSGRLRLSRVGETLYCLFAPNDSPQFRLIHTENVGKESLLVGGVRLDAAVQSNGSKPGATSVLWKDITIRAERISDWAGEDTGGREPTGNSDDKVEKQ